MSEKMVRIKFLDGQVREFPVGTTVVNVAGVISPSLRKNAVAGKVNNQIVDLNYELNHDASLSVLTLDSEEGIYVLRHTSAHVLAQAVKRLYGNVKLGIGPVIEDGFYYDMKLEQSLNSDDLHAIEKEMEKVISENYEIQRIEVSYEEAERLFEENKEPYKIEILKGLPKSEKITLYKQGEFVDLCRGPHLPSTGFIKAFKLTRVSGAYWRG